MMQTDRIEIGYQLTFVTPFHFGTGLRNGLVHRTVSRDAGDYLYIPGSSLKGALRERCEQLARLFNLKAGEPHDEHKALAEFNPDANIVERIFGSRFRPGTLFFDDALMIQEDKDLFAGQSNEKKYLNWQTQQRTQVGMSRLTRTARPGFLYTSEFGLPYLRFEGRIYGLLRGFQFNEQQRGTYALLLLLAGLASLDHLGGNNSSGGGRLAPFDYSDGGNSNSDDRPTSKITMLKVGDEIQQPVAWFKELESLEYYAIEREVRK